MTNIANPVGNRNMRIQFGREITNSGIYLGMAHEEEEKEEAKEQEEEEKSNRRMRRRRQRRTRRKRKRRRKKTRGRGGTINQCKVYLPMDQIGNTTPC